MRQNGVDQASPSSRDLVNLDHLLTYIASVLTFTYTSACAPTTAE